MKESFWGWAFVVAGIIGVALIILMIRLTLNDQNDYYVLKETTEASMYDAIDIDYYRYYGEFRIVRDRFVESFIRRWSSSSTNNNDVLIEINDVIEMPPKVSVTVKTGRANISYSKKISDDEEINLNDIVVNKIDGILETIDYEKKD